MTLYCLRLYEHACQSDSSSFHLYSSSDHWKISTCWFAFLEVLEITMTRHKQWRNRELLQAISIFFTLLLKGWLNIFMDSYVRFFVKKYPGYWPCVFSCDKLVCSKWTKVVISTAVQQPLKRCLGLEPFWYLASRGFGQKKLKLWTFYYECLQHSTITLQCSSVQHAVVIC